MESKHIPTDILQAMQEINFIYEFCDGSPEGADSDRVKELIMMVNRHDLDLMEFVENFGF